jgi:hypothetical protein
MEKDEVSGQMSKKEKHEISSIEKISFSAN